MSFANDVQELNSLVERINGLDHLAQESDLDFELFYSIKNFLGKLSESVNIIDQPIVGTRQLQQLSSMVTALIHSLQAAYDNSDAIYIMNLKNLIMQFNDSPAANILRSNENSITHKKYVNQIQSVLKEITNKVRDLQQKIELSNSSQQKTQQEFLSEVDNFNSKIESMQQILQNDFDTISQELESVNASIELHEKELTSTLYGYQKTAEELKADTEKEYQSQYDRYIDLTEKSHSEYVAHIAGESENMLKETKTSLAEHISDAQNEFRRTYEEPSRKKLDSLKDLADDQLEDFKIKKAKLSKFLGIAGNDSFTVHYQKAANSNACNALIFRILTIFLLFTGAIVSLFLLYEIVYSGSPVNFVDVVLKFLSVAAFAPITTYCGFQASRFRFQSERFAATSLQLAALPTFIEQLPEEDRMEVLRMVAEEVFVESFLTSTKHHTGDIAAIQGTSVPGSEN